MKKKSSAENVALLARGLAIEEMPLENRSDMWWDIFWTAIGKAEAERLKEREIL